MNTQRIFILLVCFFSQVIFAQPELQGREYFSTVTRPMAFEGVVEGQSYGVSGGMVLSIGGESADGTLLDTVQLLPVGGEDAKPIMRTLTRPIAFSAATTFKGKVYLAGGLGPDGVSSRVFSLEWKEGTLIETALPDLPEPLMLAGLGVHRSTSYYYLYVLGGVGSETATEASDRVYELELPKNEQEVSSWQQMDAMPFGPRVLPAVVETYNELVVFGGYELSKDGRLNPVDTCWGFARIPRDGHAEEGWEVRAPVPIALARPAFSKTGQSHITVVGGDTASGTLAELLAGKKAAAPLSNVWFFHDPTSVWHPIGEVEHPGFGGAFSSVSNSVYVLAGARDATGKVLPATQFTFEVSTKKLQWPDWIMLGLYFAVVAAIGWHFAKKQTGAESFALGNRNTKWWAAGISLMASGVSTISFMALPALTACTGLATKGPLMFMIVGMVVSAFVTFPILRRLKITSTFEYIEQRFGVGLRMLGSFNSIVSQMMGRIGIVVMLPALAISTMIGLDPWISILAMGLVTTIYSAAGGFEAVIWTDVVQGLLLLFGFMTIGLLAFLNIDGGWSTLMEYGHELNRLNLFLVKPDVRIPNMWYAIVGFTLQTMAFASDQVTAQRVLSIPMKDVRKIAFMAGFFGLFTALLSGAVGFMLFGFFKNNPGFLNPIMENDQMVPIFIVNKIPVGLAGLILATLFAAAMSTVSSSVNVCGVLVGEDFYKRLVKNVTPKQEMRMMQAVTLISGGLGTGMALWLLTMDLPTLWESFTRIMAYIGGGFGGIYILGMFTRRTHELGAILGVIVSFFMAYYLNHSELNVHYSALGLMITGSCIIVGYFSSLILPWRRKPLRGLTIFDQISDQEAEANFSEPASST